ncbi:PTS sugar transporter subunit IIA [Haliovirga abyssi]|uniref:MerR family transcriptional regulator n=1 Tax=Haliovirga abyssi TaxID=2996794 RepID=A0AAU9E0M2_9FUSO|nr:PTS sugar transporter subunit IIA [Haliovirga abyssi]BDU51455.1 MerR family transcriptional regulator [Haliovirga abyssi]
MNLKIADITEILNVSEKTIYRWIKSGKIPAYKINGQYRFSEEEINRWISENKMVNRKKEIEDEEPINLPDLLGKGGFYEVEGDDVKEVIENMVGIIKLPVNLKKDKLIEELIKREEMISTGIGNGIAVPHPQEKVIEEIEDERVFVCFLKKPIDYNALDGKKIHTLFLILSARKERHIELLAKISFLSRNKEFLDMLELQSKEKIIEFIRLKKVEWDEIMERRKKI